MRKNILIGISIISAFTFGFSCQTWKASHAAKSERDTKTAVSQTIENMKLGAFSISLSVKDLAVSKAFYENLGFKVKGGAMEQNYIVMKNENSIIGLFQGMFEGNMLTFNPGWDEDAKNIEKFDDIRAIQKHLKAKGITLVAEADEKTTGPASIVLSDPDGNVILVDQHR